MIYDDASKNARVEDPSADDVLDTTAPPEDSAPALTKFHRMSCMFSPRLVFDPMFLVDVGESGLVRL